MLFDRVSFSSLQQFAEVHVEMVSAPGPTCAPVPTARSPHPVDPSQVVKPPLSFPEDSFEAHYLQFDGLYFTVCIEAGWFNWYLAKI